MTARIPLPSRDEMSGEQQEVHDEVVQGKRGTIIGPLRAAIHVPELARRWSAFGEALRFGTTLPRRVTELAIIVTARRWTSQVEWWVHAKAAIEAGVPQAAVEAIRSGASPLLVEQDAETYAFACEMQTTGRVALPAYQAVLARWGVKGVVELTAVIGYYTMVSMTLNAHGIPLPDGVAPVLDDPQGGGLAALPDATPA